MNAAVRRQDRGETGQGSRGETRIDELGTSSLNLLEARA